MASLARASDYVKTSKGVLLWSEATPFSSPANG
jgi:hypothetical protein